MNKALLKGIVLAGVLAASTAQADIYYVSSYSPMATEDGTKAYPFKTLTNALDGTPTLNDGDEIRIGTGTYPITTIDIPSLMAGETTGITIRGGYAGWNAVTNEFDDSQGADAAARPVTITSSAGRAFSIFRKTRLEGLTMDVTGNDYAIYLGGKGSSLNQVNLQANYRLLDIDADGVLIGNSTFHTSNCLIPSPAIFITNDAQMTLEDSFLTHAGCGYTFFLESRARAIVRRNELYIQSADRVFYGAGFLHAYQNYIHGDPANPRAFAFDPGSINSFYWVVNNNSISHLIHAFLASKTESYYVTQPSYNYGNTIHFDFDDNLVFMNGNDSDGSFYAEDYPYSKLRVRGNCIQHGAGSSFASLSSYEGFYALPNSIAELEELAPENFSGNVPLETPVMNPKATYCNGKGITPTAMPSKPVARPYAYDTTGNTAIPDIAVHPGEVFWLDADLSISFDRGPLTYQWSQLSGPVPNVLDAGGLAAEEVTGFTTTPGVYKFQLRVKAAEGDNVLSDPATVTVWVMPKVTVTTSAGTVRGQYKYLQAAVHAAQPFDTIHLPAGMFFIHPYDDGEDTYGSVEINGKSDLIIQGQGHGPSGTILGNASGENVFEIAYSRNITIRNLEFMDVTNSGSFSIDAYAVKNLILENIYQDGSKVDPDEAFGVYAEYSSTTIRNSTFRYMYLPIETESAGQHTIENNTFIAGDGDAIYIDQSIGYNDWVKIRNNLFDRKTAGSDVIYIDDMYGQTGFDGSGIGVLIENNTIKNPYGDAIYIDDVYYSGTLIQGNLIYTDRRWTDTGDNGIYIYDTAAQILNNVIFNSYYDAIYNDSGSIHVEGNVIANSKNYGIDNDNYTCDDECTYYATARNNVLFNNHDGPYYKVRVLDGNTYGDPKFADPDRGNFTLAADSPLHDMPGIGFKPVPPAPVGLQGEPLPGAARLTFQAVASATGYKAYWGESAGVYAQSQDLGAEQVVVIDGLAAIPYYFAVSARNANGEGRLSEAVIVVPEEMSVPVSEPSKPSVYGVHPSRISVGQIAELEISGSDFQEGVKVYVGSMEIEVVEITETALKVKTTQDLQHGVHPVIIVNRDLGRGALPQALTVSRIAVSEADGGCATGGNAAGFLLMLAPLALLLRRRAR